MNTFKPLEAFTAGTWVVNLGYGAIGYVAEVFSSGQAFIKLKNGNEGFFNPEDVGGWAQLVEGDYENGTYITFVDKEKGK